MAEDDLLEIKIEGDEEYGAFLASLSNARLNKWITYSYQEQAWKFARIVARDYLSGQKMRVRPEAERMKGRERKAWVPHTRDTVVPYKRKKDQAVVVRPGFGITGWLNYLERFVGTEHEFMVPAWRQYNQGNKVQKATEENINKMLEKAARKKGVKI